MASFLHTMVRITDPDRSRAFYEALGFRFDRDMDIVRNGEVEASGKSGFGPPRVPMHTPRTLLQSL